MSKKILFKNFDWVLFAVVGLLISFGLLTIYSTAFAETDAKGNKAISQAVFAALGFILVFVFAKIDYRVFRKFTGLFYVIMIALLLVVEFAGSNVLGATRWINLGFFQLQPSEVAKIISIIILAKYFSDHNEEMWRVKHIIISGIYIIIPVLMVAKQPDLGTAIVIFSIWLGMLFVSNVKRSTLIKMAGIGLAILPLMWFTLHDYQKNRILTLFSPDADVLGKGWNVEQANIAIGSGQFFGRGFGYGSQSHLNFLPMQHTDFAFAVLAEEMGFLGSVILIGLYFLLLYRVLAIAKSSRDSFGMFIATGTAVMFFVHIFVNIGMNIRLMPATGIPLPFISAGGTAILINLAAIGILESIYSRHKKIDF
ncbi:TPA: rod shape-determining protein RodA [candidate division CPR2 bacterium]|uniref:Peptidoglycan glycosyltransferase RodA n=1 Tax=candidate division CPR2 bacterium GW2011_GWC1_41_48 TaxID=1618344 RepID=A0A0G0WC94_UNCC2|nr:MAG: Rod shape-determining protein RodA [candidate division CPR2 bacterium GW2011_GWC2_39_35]KKR27082.1 MAG: Rod shape-determining protein RodA [candidate division CPR2 bacterium GW2011_GWD1_39_7]KKR27618.1 MAG: Rod shape-determining protein RodA [candidate division CPR2 bacterium GW2011_GWD2_39_7]KKS09677.1 MAG: Rod shape-determining protein RodA [candidate division CPR2 bacterium GW2011_GWC1_41_48]OGB71537.1 MAG: rod shape-determining protein RodA [candidate division CPR2 bacterium GWD2_39